MRTEITAAEASSIEKIARLPSPVAIAITIAVLVGAVAAAGVVSLVLIVRDLGIEEVVVYGIGTSPSRSVKAYIDPDLRLLLFKR